MLRCVLCAGLVFPQSLRTTSSHFDHPCVGFLSTQSVNPSNPSINNNHYYTIHPTNRRSTLSIKSVQEQEKRKEQWDTNRYSQWHLKNELILMFVLFGYNTNNNNQQNVHHSKTMMMHCRSTLQCHHVQCMTYVFVFMFLSLHTNKQTTTQHMQTKVAA